MNDQIENRSVPFRQFLKTAFESGNYATDDIIAFIMPLFEEVLTFHEAGLVAPFEKEDALFITDKHLDIDENFAHDPKPNLVSVRALFEKTTSDRFTIVENLKVDTDVDEGSQSVLDLNVQPNINEPLEFPAYLPGFMCFEQRVGHHDAQTDIFCLGLALGSIALNVDLYEVEDLKAFAKYRKNPVNYQSRIHPTISTLIKEMTELDRGKRTQDLYDVIHRLRNYRDFDPTKQTDLSSVAGWVSKTPVDRNQIVLHKLKNRLFDTSRRNRLLYYKPNMRFLNLTVSSVPMVLHYQSIRPELLFTWNDEISSRVKGMKEIVLNKYLRFEDHLYVPSTLDKIRSESRRDVQEYGFSQQKLVITFLNWHNLREDRQERIQSPLLLIPVELRRNKKLKEDHYVLKVLDNQAEVNPVLSNHLHDLYGIRLPDFVDLDEISLGEFYAQLKNQIDEANQGITLNYIDKPRIKLVHSVAKQTVGNYKKRLKRTGSRLENYKNIPYSYQPDLYKPLGLEIFRQRVEPRATFLEFLINEDIKIASYDLTEKSVTRERQLFEIASAENDPFSWDFDLCNVVLGNFNYKKMSLVRDYNQIVDKSIDHQVFENLFSTLPRQRASHVINHSALEEWNHVIAADPTQTQAILHNRTGESYIIQGPPGTGKSQTITNLIADFAARGKNVLFVCEKRAALDVVYHRLKQQGLDKICCYIHDSQSDKREFIQNLKATYEDFATNRIDGDSLRKTRHELLKKMREQLDVIDHFHKTSITVEESAGLEVRKFLERMTELKDHAIPLKKVEQERLPHYREWLEYGSIVRQLNDTLADAGIENTFADHPFSNLKDRVFEGDHPYLALQEKLSECKSHLAKIIAMCESKLKGSAGDSFSALKRKAEYALQLQPISDTKNLCLFDLQDARTRTFEELIQAFREAQLTARKNAEANIHWIAKFTKQDTLRALSLAVQCEGSFFSFLNGAWRQLKKQLRAHYDFAKHAVKPSFKTILQSLKDEYDALESVLQREKEIEKTFFLSNVEDLYGSLTQLRRKQEDPDLQFFLRHSAPSALITAFAAIHGLLSDLDGWLSTCLHSFENKSPEELQDELENILLNAENIDELLPALREYIQMPDALKNTVRSLPADTVQTEATIATRTLEHIYNQNKKFKGTDHSVIERAVAIIQAGYKQLLKLNADLILASIHHRFLGHLELSAMATSQLSPEQKQFKKEYNEGRRILENEFGKSMRYKSIRELATRESGLLLKDLKPIWLMSPLSVSDSLPIDGRHFDAIIFDEASQITLEEGIPSLFRAPQAIIVGDEKQMPPSNFFTAKADDPDDLESFNSDDDEILSSDTDSLLVQGSRKLSSVMLGWHYRSRYETLISYSNHAFYEAALLTIPDKTIHHSAKSAIDVQQSSDAAMYSNTLSDRSISFHYLPNGVYEKRVNPDEANYIACLVKELLQKEVRDSIGIVAFSQEQQHAIEDALVRLASADKNFEQQLEEAYNRSDDDQFAGLFVKNLENVQGDERDIIIMSVCYGFDSRKRMIMNFGPINKKGGEKRLNVIFSRAKKHMAVISSIKHFHITNEYNEGASYFKRFLHYAELISQGNTGGARNILDGLVANKTDKNPNARSHAAVNQIRMALQKEGYEVDAYVGQSAFKASLAVKANAAGEEYALSIMVDDDLHYGNENLLEQYYQRPAILRDFGWNVVHVFTKDWIDNRDKVLKMIIKRMTEAPDSVPITDLLPPIDPVMATSDSEAHPVQSESVAVQHEADQLHFERVEYVDGSSNKFWEAAVDGSRLVVRFGRIGTKGQTQVKSFPSEDQATKEKEKLLREKMNKGYHSH